MIKNSIIIPAYNEYENIIELISEIENEFSDEVDKKEIELIIVNDGSNDKTRFSIKENIQQKKIKIKIIHLIKNRGKSFALEIAFNYIDGNNIVIIDADQQYRVKDIKKLINLIEHEGYDLVNGKRENRKDDSITKITSKFYNFIIRKILNLECEDFFSGLKVFKAKIIKVIDFRDLCRFIILLANLNGFKVHEEPIEHKKRIHGQSRYNLFSRIKLFVNDFITLFFLRFINRYKVYLLNIYLRFSLVIYILYYSIFLLFSENFTVLNLFNDKILILLISSNIIALILNSILKIHESHHKISFNERSKNIDLVETNNE
jgi:glycosyltransferase involved in cell wall biosynthesis